MEKTPKTLADVLAPASTDKFVQNDLGRSFQYFPGHPGKFSSLLTWPDLNEILALHQLDTPRLRLARDGQPIPADSFLSYHPARRPNAPATTRIRSAELTQHLQQGATLILDAVDELHAPVRDLAADIEKALRARIQVNLYAGWRTSPGFDLHWDGHDVLILQISGRKHWKVYPMTREHPVEGDPKKEAPPEKPVWEGLLEDGDLLYIPRGWWHVAVPLDEPTLHLTVGIHRASGLDFMAWFADRLRSSTDVRNDLPRLATAAAKEAHLECLRQAWEQAWQPGLLDEYFSMLDAQARSRPHFGLPWTAQPSVLPPEDEGWAVKYLVARPVEWHRNGDDTIVVRGNGKEATFAAAAGPVLEALRAHQTCSLAQLQQTSGETIPPATLRVFVAELVNAGLAAVVPDRAA
ncbi:MAG TPA: cupin [Solibacterales bacterium]|nr:cupin [Bryobacterales bacterium]